MVRFYKLAPEGRALDIACGTGENAIFLARKGFCVDAFDISHVAVNIARRESKKKNAIVNFKVCEAKKFPYGLDKYDLILNFYFLERDILKKIQRALRKGGFLIFETYNFKYLNINPSFSSDYTLKEGELLELLNLEIVHYDESSHITTYVGRKT